MDWRSIRCFCIAAFASPTGFAQQPAQGEGYFHSVGFQSRYYQISSYTGSRVLEHNETGRYARYVEVVWTQASAVDSQGRIWIADKAYHQIILQMPETRYIKWPSYYIAYAGQRGTPGHRDGSRKLAMFDSPMGLVVGNLRGKPVLFIADTNNHCIRRMEYASGRTITIVGRPRRPGLTDGKGLETRFSYPMSLGVDSAMENLFALDNGKRLRHIDLTTTPPTVATLVGGSCRAVAAPPVIMFGAIIARTVGCHPDWHARDAGEMDVGLTSDDVMCVGHMSTCAPRMHPALNDKHAKFLIEPPEELRDEVMKLPHIVAVMPQPERRV